MAVLERILARPRVAYLRAVLDTYDRAAGGLLANGLAFAALFAVIPIALVTLGLAGGLAGNPGIQAALAAALVRAFPPVADLIDGALAALSGGAVAASIIGIVGLVWTVSRFYVTLDVAFSRIFSGTPERGGFRRTARGLIWVGTLLGAVAILLVVGSAAVALQALIPGRSPLGPVAVVVLSSPLVLVALAIAGIALVYRIVPPRTPSWRAVLAPAAAVGVAIVALSQAFVFLAPRLVGVAVVAGSLGAAFIALAWLSLTFQVLLYGAAWVSVREGGSRDALTSALASPASAAEPRGGGQ